MASTLDNLLDSVKSSIMNHFQQNGNQSPESGGLLGKIEDLFNMHKQANAQNGRGIAPASQDPYGDPADQIGNRH